MLFTTLALALAVGQSQSEYDLPFPEPPFRTTPAALETKPQSPKKNQAAPTAVSAISDRLRQYIAAKEIAGAVTLVATPDQFVHFDATGQADLGLPEAMRKDAIFWIASMSKPTLATLLLMLQEEGLLSVDDPVEKYLPEFKGLKTTDGKPARLTIRHLLTHTSGMGEITGARARDCKTLAAVIPLYVAKPVAFTPGSKWAYCQSGINTGGRIAEVVTGEPLDKLLERRLFGPLGMKDTTFYLTDKQLPRLAKSYRRTDKGDLEPTAISFLNGKSPTSRDRFPAPNGGLFSTAADYARFCQMILRGGELDGKRYLKPETVKLMTTIQTAGLKTGFTDGNGWGLGWCVIRQPQGVTAMLSPGTFGHGGAYGTQAWIDPTKKLVYILMVQRANFPNSDASEVRKGFQEAASAAFAGVKGKAGAEEAQHDPDIKKLIGELDDPSFVTREKATLRLAEVGKPALPALYDAWDMSAGEARARAEMLILSIRKAHDMPTWVNGMEFKLLVDKEWVAGPFSLGLRFTNTIGKPCRMKVPGLFIDVKDANGKRMVRNVFQGGGSRWKTTEPINCNQSITYRLNGELSGEKDGLDLRARDPSAMIWNTIERMAKGKYELSVTYANLSDKRPPDGLVPYWVGKAEMPKVMIEVK